MTGKRHEFQTLEKVRILLISLRQWVNSRAVRAL